MVRDGSFPDTCSICGSDVLRRFAVMDGMRLVDCRSCGNSWDECHGADPGLWPDLEPSDELKLADMEVRLGVLEDVPTPEDIPIREKGTGNVYYVRVEGGALKLYDVDDVLVKSWWEVWK